MNRKLSQPTFEHVGHLDYYQYYYQTNSLEKSLLFMLRGDRTVFIIRS